MVFSIDFVRLKRENMSYSSALILASGNGDDMGREVANRPRKAAMQERSRMTVGALVEATARILVDEGFEKASTNRIAEVAGVSIGSLYQYFPCKEALVLAVVEQHNLEIMQVVGSTLEDMEILPLEEALRMLVAVAVEAHRVNPKLHRVLTEQIPRLGSLESVETVSKKTYAQFRAFLERRRDQLFVPDIELAAFVCATSIEALAHNAVLYREDIVSRDAARALVDETTRLVVGYLRPASDLSAARSDMTRSAHVLGKRAIMSQPSA
jgi:AcrR family transcriptional regulator